MKVRTIRLLLVEDNPVDVRILRADFAKSGTNFKFTATAELHEAFQILQQEPTTSFCRSFLG
jgi:CheY-like chemotaxis protein